MTRCLDCSNLTSHSAKMALHGFGNCKVRAEWSYLSITSEHQCDKFAQVTPEVAKTREAWASKGGAA